MVTYPSTLSDPKGEHAMTSAAYHRMEVQAHSALATTGRIRAALPHAGTMAGVGLYVPFQAVRIWRKMHTLAAFIAKRDEIQKPSNPPTDQEAAHSLALLRELHEAVTTITRTARASSLIRAAYGPLLGPIERDTGILGSFLDDVEMSMSADLRASLQKAIAELTPPTGTDWRASLEAMRN